MAARRPVLAGQGSGHASFGFDPAQDGEKSDGACNSNGVGGAFVGANSRDVTKVNVAGVLLARWTVAVSVGVAGGKGAKRARERTAVGGADGVSGAAVFSASRALCRTVSCLGGYGRAGGSEA